MVETIKLVMDIQKIVVIHAIFNKIYLFHLATQNYLPVWGTNEGVPSADSFIQLSADTKIYKFHFSIVCQ